MDINLSSKSIVSLVIIIICIIAVIVISSLDSRKSLNRIKRKPVGDGQYGDAQFISDKEKKETYKTISYTPKKWRKGKNLPEHKYGLIVGEDGKGKAIVDLSDSNCLMIGPPGIGKTTRFLYANIEYSAACGTSFICTDTKGDVALNFINILRKYYGYQYTLIDFRNPLDSDGYNFLSNVNKYMDRYKETNNLRYKAKAEKYAKIISHSIVASEAMRGQNSYFYNSAEGLITAIILILAEFAEPYESHLINVFKLILEGLKPEKGVDEDDDKDKKRVTKLHILLDKLPENHKAVWFAGSASGTTGGAMANVLTTALSEMLSFIDSEVEQMICRENPIDFETFDEKPSAMFIVIPEEDATKHFLVSLLISQCYDTLIGMASENPEGNHLKRVVRFFDDEIGTIPKIHGFCGQFTSGRSRKIYIMPMIQEFSQLSEKYGKDGLTTILGATQTVITGGFSPLSESAKIISESLDTQTISSGSVSKSGGINNKSTQTESMIQRLLMTQRELKTLPKGKFIVQKLSVNPMMVTLPYYTDWGIKTEDLFRAEEKTIEEIQYTSIKKMQEAIEKVYAKAEKNEDVEVQKQPKKRKKKVQKESDESDFLNDLFFQNEESEMY